MNGYITKTSKWTIAVNNSFPDAHLYVSETTRKDGIRGPFKKVPCSRYARVYKSIIPFNQKVSAFYIKRFLYRSRFDYIKHFFRADRAHRAVQGAELLKSHGFDTPEVIAYFRSGNIARRKAVLITKSIDHAQSVNTILDSFAKNKDCLHEKRHFIRELGQVIGRMHASNLFHGDLQFGNILVSHNHGQWKFYFLDNERTKRIIFFKERRRLKNLVDMNIHAHNITTTDKLRFLKNYFAYCNELIPKKKEILKNIVFKTEERLRKKRTTKK